MSSVHDHSDHLTTLSKYYCRYVDIVLGLLYALFCFKGWSLEVLSSLVAYHAIPLNDDRTDSAESQTSTRSKR